MSERKDIDDLKLELAAHILQPGFSLLDPDVSPIAHEPTASHEDTARVVGQLLSDRIHASVQTPDSHLTTDLSGGADSTSVSLVAARHMNPEPLHAFVQYSADYPSGDLPYAEQYAKLEPNIVLHALPAKSPELPFTGLQDTSLQGLFGQAPYRGLAIISRERQRLLAARESGTAKIHMHLTGDGADALFDPDPVAVISDLLEYGKPEQAKQVALQVGRTMLSNPDAILKRVQSRRKSNLNDSYIRLAEQLIGKKPVYTKQDWLPSLADTMQWLTPDMRHRLSARCVIQANSDYSGISLSDFLTQQALADSRQVLESLQSLGKQHGVHVVAPFLEQPIIDQVLRLPAHQRVAPNTYKALLSGALTHATGHTLGRRSKGSYTEQLFAGLLQEKASVRALLSDSLLERHNIIDTNAVLTAIEQACTGQRISFGSLTAVLATEKFLRAHGYAAPARPKARHVASGAPAPRPKIPQGTLRLTDSAHVVAGPHGALAVLNSENGVTQVYGPRGGSILRTILRTHSAARAIDVLDTVEAAPHMHHAHAVTAIAVQGLSAQILQSVGTQRPQVLPTYTRVSCPSVEAGQVMRTKRAVLKDITPREQVAAIRAYEASLQYRTASLQSIRAEIQEANAQAEQPISYAEALRNTSVLAHTTVRNAGRIACYELSLASVQLAHDQNRSIGWSIGVAFYPNRWHAFTVAEGKPVVGGDDVPVQSIYRTIFEVS